MALSCMGALVDVPAPVAFLLSCTSHPPNIHPVGCVIFLFIRAIYFASETTNKGCNGNEFDCKDAACVPAYL